MKKYFKIIVSALFISFLFISCGDLFTQKNPSKAEGALTLSFKSQPEFLEIQKLARTATPEKNKSYKDVENWTVTFESQTDNVKKVFESQRLNESSEITLAVPAGLTYTVTIEGTVDDGELLKYVGKVSGVSVTAESTETCDVYVELEKTAGGRGKLNFSCDVPAEYDDNDFELELWDLINFTETPDFNYYTDNGADSFTHTDGHLSIEINDFPSGFYELKLSYQSNSVNYFLAVSEPIVEIADGLTTEVDTKAYAYTNRTYYATTGASKGNGLSSAYPININTLFEKIEDYVSQAEEIKIYLPDGTDLVAKNVVIPMVSDSLKLAAYIGNKLFYSTDTGYVNELYVSEDGNDNGTGQSDSPLATFGAAWDFVKLYASSDAEITIHVDGSVAINEANRCAISGVKSVSIIGDRPNIGSVIQGTPYGKYYTDGNGVCFSNVETINIENVAIRTILGGNGSASSQCAGLRFDGTSNIKNVTIDGCTFYRNEEGSIGESILFIGGTATPITVSIVDCAFEENGELGDSTAGVIKVLDANVDMSIEECKFADNYKADLYISADQSHDYEPVVTIRNSDFKPKDDSSANIVYKAGKLNVEGAVITAIGVSDGKTVNVSDILTTESNILLLPDNYEQHEAIVSVADKEDLTISGLYDVVALFNEGYTITEEGYIEDTLGMIKHITISNWEEFIIDNFENGSTLVIHSSMAANIEVADDETVPAATLFFINLESNDKNIILDLSSYEADSYSELSFMNSAVKVILPDTLENLSNNAFEIEQQLEEIVISKSNPNYVTIDGVLYKKDASGNPSVIIRYPPSKLEESFSFTLPETVTSIGHAAFAYSTMLETITNFNQITKCEDSSKDLFRHSTGISSIELSASLTELAPAMFRESYITSITIPAGVTKINDSCFEGCSNLVEVTFMGTVPPVIGENAFLGCNSLQIYVPSGTGDAYKNAVADDLKTKITEINYSTCVVGDFILKNGRILSKGSTPEAGTVAAVIVRAAEGNKPALGVGIMHNKTGLSWCIDEAAGFNINLTELQGTSTSGYMDGNKDWEILKTACNDAEEHPENYPAWNYSLTYAETNNLTGDLAEGWYLPTLAELYTIYENIETVDESLSKAGGNQFDGDWYLSCSQSTTDNNSIGALYFSDGEEDGSVYKSDSDFYACSVKAFY